MRALSKLDQWQPGTRLDSWLYRIAQNAWFDRARAAKVRGENIEIDKLAEVVGEDGRAVTESRLTLGVVAKAMARLPHDQRVLIDLVCIDGMSYKDAAETLEVPLGTVMSRLARARSSLHAAIFSVKAERKTKLPDRSSCLIQRTKH